MDQPETKYGFRFDLKLGQDFMEAERHELLGGLMIEATERR